MSRRISIFRERSDSLGSLPISPRYLSKNVTTLSKRDTMMNNGVESPTGRNTETLSMREKGEKERRRRRRRKISKTISVIPLTVNRRPRLVNSGGKESPLSGERAVSQTPFLPPPPFLSTPTAFHSVTIGRNRGVYATNRYGREETMANETKGGEDRTSGAGGGVEEGLAHDGTTDNCVK